MPKETPFFDTKPLKAAGSKSVKKNPVKQPKKNAKKAFAPKPITTPNEEKITRELNAIYQEPDGTLPNMKKIESKSNSPFARFLVGLLAVAVIAAAVIWVKFLWLGGETSQNNSDLTLTISGPSGLTIGATSTYTVFYSNTQNTELKNFVLNIYPPAGFIFLSSSVKASNEGNNEWQLGAVPPRGSGAITITAIPYGDLNSGGSWRALARFEPSSLSSVLEQVATLSTTINTSPLQLNISGADKTAANSDVTYKFSVSALPNFTPGKMELAPAWPSSFVISSSSPALTNNRWLIYSQKKSTSTPSNLTFSVTGKFTNAANSSTPFTAAVLFTPAEKNVAYTVAKAELPTAIFTNEVSASLAINGNLSNFTAKPGEMLNITLQVKNYSAPDIKNASLKLILDSPAIKKLTLLNWPALSDPLDGRVVGEQINNNLRRGAITWTAKQLPALAKIKAGQEASLDFQLPLRTNKDIDLVSLSSSSISAFGQLDYTDTAGNDQTLNFNSININIDSDLNFEARAEAAKSADNKRQFNINWVLTNSFHPLKNATLSASIFGDINFLPPVSPSAGELNFDNQSKTIIWNIAAIPVSVDVLTLPFSVVINKENSTQTVLVSKVKISATDAITGQTINLTGDEFSLPPQ